MKSLGTIGPYRTLLIVVLLALISGSCLYIFFRSGRYTYQDWIETVGINNPAGTSRSPVLRPGFLPEWMVYSLPNALWAFAYSLLITGIWKKDRSPLRIFWMTSIFLLVAGFELLQLARILPGTFSIPDLIAGMLGMLAGIIVGLKSIGIKQNTLTS